MALVLCAGCAGLRPQRGGKALAKLPSVGLSARPQAEAMEVSMHQPENPSQAASQTIKRVTETVAPSPPPVAVIPSAQPQPTPAAPPATPVVLRQTEEITTTIGAAQKDVSREITAKLASARWVQVLGVLMILAGCATFHPAVKLFVASKTVTASLFAFGVLLVFLPFVIVGNETMLSIVGVGCVLALLVYFMGQRNARHKAIVDTYTTPHPLP